MKSLELIVSKGITIMNHRWKEGGGGQPDVSWEEGSLEEGLILLSIYDLYRFLYFLWLKGGVPRRLLWDDLNSK